MGRQTPSLLSLFSPIKVHLKVPTCVCVLLVSFRVAIAAPFTDANWVSMGNMPGVNGTAYASVRDAAGNLYGTTRSGGANGAGTIYEIVKSGAGYSSTPTVLVSFSGPDGANTMGDLLVDAAGNLFGTTENGGSHNDGTIFEILKDGVGYSSTPTVLASFNGSNGLNPIYGSLIADSAGNLFGTTEVGGSNGNGTVFEITGSGFVPFGSSAPLLDAAVVNLREADGVMCVRLGATTPEIEVPLGHAEPGDHVRIAIRAGDILLATKLPSGLSARNIQEGRIE